MLVSAIISNIRDFLANVGSEVEAGQLKWKRQPRRCDRLANFKPASVSVSSGDPVCNCSSGKITKNMTSHQLRMKPEWVGGWTGLNQCEHETRRRVRAKGASLAQCPYARTARGLLDLPLGVF